MSELYPLRFHPVYKLQLWGGRRFETILKRDLQPDRRYAESWEVCDHPAGQSIVAEGPLAGVSLHDLVLNRGEELLGRHHPQTRFPLLLKYLDAEHSLSIQVHPDDALAAQLKLSDGGKAEAWFVIHAEPTSAIWCGLREWVDRDRLLQAIAEGSLQECLCRFKPAVGECFMIPPGTVHSMGGGVLVAEIQQPSDNTFRLFDWNRVGPDGKPRQLHVDEALRAIQYNQAILGPSKPRPTERPFVKRAAACDKFVLDCLEVETAQTVGGDARCHVLTVVAGSVRIERDAVQRPLYIGQTILIPAALGVTEVQPATAGPAILLDAYLP